MSKGRGELGEGTANYGAEKLGEFIGSSLLTLLRQVNGFEELPPLDFMLQCKIIRTTELAAAQEKLNELERQKEDSLKFYSPASLLCRFQAMNKTEKESENQHWQLLDNEMDLGAFMQKYRKSRTTYLHRQALIHLAAKTSSTG
ncbi:hypothetical protein CJ030_MR6G021357 [Morella rubra]|uniref:VPS37 C-terminal domain-containing protein n=1 Tax=Morella rubra TaxID=262757 RepID=A0A6A1VFG3_9ROSI|nr:hypothetical protein CJ030_MR6G021357 [Morella rubra]